MDVDRRSTVLLFPQPPLVGLMRKRVTYSKQEGEPMIATVRLLLAGSISLAAVFGCAGGEDPEVSAEAAIRAEVEAMADDFVNLRRLTGFVHEMPLAEAYRWQDEMIEILRPAMGEVVGYKTGGHDPNPPNANFPPGGIRAHLLSGMFREDGDAIRVDETSAGFLEADFAFRVGDTSINTAETDLEILAGLDAVIPVRGDSRSLLRPGDRHRESDDRCPT